MVLKNFKKLLAFVGAVVVLLVVYGLLTIKEKSNPVGITNGALHKLYPTEDTNSLRP
jgi:hypothetical protein